MSAYYIIIKPLYHFKCTRTVIKGTLLARSNAPAADRRSEKRPPPLNPNQKNVHPPPKTESEYRPPPP